MTTSILVTKLFIHPTRPDLLSRPRLIQRLNKGFHRKLTLISAPVGFGKTTLGTEWLVNLRRDTEQENEIDNRIAWLSIDEGDNDQACFLAYLIIALNLAERTETTL
jgi:LuxR family maltose regulon positive regulatory protein